MTYTIYLLGVGFLLVMGIGFHRNLMDYMDSFTLLFVLLPCVLVLFCTKSLKAFGEAFLYAFGKEGSTLISYKRNLQAVKMVIITSSVFGGLGFIIGMINSIHSLNFTSGDAFGKIIIDTAPAALSLFYPLLVCAILVPVYFIIKNRQNNV